jgi:hypothetical protein
VCVCVCVCGVGGLSAESLPGLSLCYSSMETPSLQATLAQLTVKDWITPGQGSWSSLVHVRVP